MTVGVPPVDASADPNIAPPPADAADAMDAIAVGPDRPEMGTMGTTGTTDVALTQYVNPFIGTQAAANTLEAGNTTPAAMVPFGMVQFGPDTTSESGGSLLNHEPSSATRR